MGWLVQSTSATANNPIQGLEYSKNIILASR